MAKINRRLRRQLKTCKNKEELGNLSKSTITSLDNMIRFIKSQKFLSHVNRAEKKIFIKDLEQGMHSEIINYINAYRSNINKFSEKIDIDKSNLSKNYSNMEEIGDIFTITNNDKVFLEEESINRTIKVLLDERQLFKLILRELKIKNINKEVKIEKVEEKDDNKPDIKLGWE